jgi:hypothetical protein
MRKLRSANPRKEKGVPPYLWIKRIMEFMLG